MAKDTLAKYEQDFFLLLEAGFIAVNDADEDSALKLFKAAELLRPNDPFPKLGFGYMHMCKLELKHACEMFNKILANHPNHEMAKTFLGIAMSLTPNASAKGEAILEDSRKKSHDPDIKRLAGTAMDFVEKFIKKSPSPVEPRKPKR